MSKQPPQSGTYSGTRTADPFRVMPCGTRFEFMVLSDTLFGARMILSRLINHLIPVTPRRYCRLIPAAAALIGLLLITPASAQTGVQLFTQPWADDQALHQLDIQATLLNRGHTDNADANFRLRQYQAAGRLRPSADDNAWVAGFEAGHWEITSGDPAVPQRLTDQSVAAGFRLNDTDRYDALWLTLGVGYAGNNPFTDSDAIYGQANLIYTIPVDRQSQWLVALSYNGNRVIFPDVPLPLVSYQRRVSEALSYSLGVPANTVTWRPDDRWVVRAVYVVPVTVNVAVTYDLGHGWHAVGRFDSSLNAFTIDGAPDHQRLFYSQRRLEAGLVLKSDQQIDLTLAAGYAFSQEFSTGFDARDLDKTVAVSDEPYLRVGLNLRF